jgi:hypothetical protein
MVSLPAVSIPISANWPMMLSGITIGPMGIMNFHPPIWAFAFHGGRTTSPGM